MAAPGDPDGTDTVIRRPAAAAGRRTVSVGLLAGAAAVVLAAAGGWLLLPPAVPPPTLPPPQPAPAAGLARPALLLPVARASFTEIAAHQPVLLTAFRHAENPRIIVLDFPTLAQQGRMLNRIAALVEKHGQPRDRLLTDTELDAVVRRDGGSPDTFYYGHDYRAADLRRFFALADRDALRLNPDEHFLRLLLQQEGMLEPGAEGAVISIPREGADALMDASARATILRHELAHGEYFTNPAYAAFVRRFWTDVLTEAERAGFRRYLAAEDYDAGNEDLMANEMQAYLMHTPDPRFFQARQVGLSEEGMARLRAAFLAGMPDGWLKRTLIP